MQGGAKFDDWLAICAPTARCCRPMDAKDRAARRELHRGPNARAPWN
jgi:hypothetical protein